MLLFNGEKIYSETFKLRKCVVPLAEEKAAKDAKDAWESTENFKTFGNKTHKLLKNVYNLESNFLIICKKLSVKTLSIHWC